MIQTNFDNVVVQNHTVSVNKNTTAAINYTQHNDTCGNLHTHIHSHSNTHIDLHKYSQHTSTPKRTHNTHTHDTREHLHTTTYTYTQAQVHLHVTDTFNHTPTHTRAGATTKVKGCVRSWPVTRLSFMFFMVESSGSIDFWLCSKVMFPF